MFLGLFEIEQRGAFKLIKRINIDFCIIHITFERYFLFYVLYKFPLSICRKL